MSTTPLSTHQKGGSRGENLQEQGTEIQKPPFFPTPVTARAEPLHLDRQGRHLHTPTPAPIPLPEEGALGRP